MKEKKVTVVLTVQTGRETDGETEKDVMRLVRNLKTLMIGKTVVTGVEIDNTADLQR